MQIAILIFMIFNFIVNVGLAFIVSIAINSKVKEMRKLRKQNNAVNVNKFKKR